MAGLQNHVKNCQIWVAEVRIMLRTAKLFRKIWMHGWLGNKIILRTNYQNDKIAKNGWLGYKIILKTAKTKMPKLPKMGGWVTKSC